MPEIKSLLIPIPSPRPSLHPKTSSQNPLRRLFLLSLSFNPQLQLRECSSSLSCHLAPLSMATPIAPPLCLRNPGGIQTRSSMELWEACHLLPLGRRRGVDHYLRFGSPGRLLPPYVLSLSHMLSG